MRIGSLCSGYGGLEIGVQAVYGGTTAWVSDIDKGARKILAHRFPGVPNIGDMTAVDWTQVEPVDLICGGTPCQDLSHAGKRAGMTEGTRSNLWVSMREAIATIRPARVVWENVGGAYSAAADSEVEREPGLLGDRSGRPALRALGRVLGDLASLGYDASWHGLRAADVGAPHGRFRVFVVAADASRLRRGQGRAAGPGQEALGWSSADLAGRGDALGPTVLGSPSPGRSDRALVMLPTPQAHDARGRAGEGFNEGGSLVNALLPTPQAHDAKQGGGESAAQRQSPGRFPNPALADVPHLLPTPDASPEKYRLQGNSQQSKSLVAIGAKDTDWGQYAAVIRRWETLTRPAPAPTETGPKGNPRLAAAFSEWMMGLPAGWVTDVPDITRNEALRALGNGVVPQQAAEALRIMETW